MLMKHLVRWKLLLLIVGLPMGLAIAYFTLLAGDRYVSTAVMTVRRTGQEAPSVSGLSMLLAGVGGASEEDPRYLREYLGSLGLMNTLEARLRLRQHYTSARTDWLYRLGSTASQEDMLDYWRERVSLTLDERSGLLTVRVQGFDPDFAQQVNRSLLQEAEKFINDISHRIAHEQLTFAQSELTRAAEQLGQAQRRVVEFQTHHQMLDPQADTQATSARTAELRSRLSRLESDLTAKLAFQHDDAPDVVTLKAELAAVRQQVSRETRGATNTTKAGQLNRLAVEFEDLKSRAALAEGTYRSALTSVEGMRIEASRKLKSLVVIEAPTRPETAEYPRRAYSLATLLATCLLLYAVARLVMATIHEHRD